ncbi:hypothetical protein GCM10022226_78970 [Sphaerisporangium flaviroseum]|uniref:SMI1/KNR4 family protein n=1 Tax=Sphaerisporangium flaviroseum TaxID=509199 RepID=A0ABP7JH89_9ACTN
MSSVGVRLGEEAARLLARSGCCQIEAGLTDAEFARIEREYGFEFADDHRAFLAAGLPVSSPAEEGQTWAQPWPNWRNGDPDQLRQHLDWPTEGVLFDVQHGYWHDAWGVRPLLLQDALTAAKRHLAQVPRMIPIFAHRCLPAGRGTCRHPVLSIYQTDIIYYGSDLPDYVNREFGAPETGTSDRRKPQATVPFWRDFL